MFVFTKYEHVSDEFTFVFTNSQQPTILSNIVERTSSNLYLDMVHRIKTAHIMIPLPFITVYSYILGLCILVLVLCCVTSSQKCVPYAATNYRDGTLALSGIKWKRGL